MELATMKMPAFPNPPRPAYADDHQRWNAVVQRDAKADGAFYYSVKTTGVYCRPSCAARLAHRENVAFHLSCDEAERAGFRPCKRCRPKDPDRLQHHALKVAGACRSIESADESPALDTLARAAGMSRFHFHRVFTRITGLTPKAYAAAHRAARVRRALPNGKTVTEAIYEAGFNSNSRFYAKSSQLLGMRPKAFRDGGEGTTIRFAVRKCSLGFILVACSAVGVCAILLGDDRDELSEDLRHRFPNARVVAGDRPFARMVAQAIEFVEAPMIGLQLPLDVRGTAFQCRVWEALQKIPLGETASYAEIAQRLGCPKAVRAVAGACAANPIAIAIPCHRVLRSDGSLSGYRWGVKRKRMLLEREARMKADAGMSAKSAKQATK